MDTNASPLDPIKEMTLSALHRNGGVPQALKETNAVKKVLEDWHEDMLFHFGAEVGINLGRMFSLFNQMPFNLSTLAYVVRNLLELNVWIEYSCKSKANARRFYEDKYRDGLGLQQALKDLVSAFAQVQNIPSVTELHSALDRIKNTIQQRANTAGIASLDLDYKRVVDAAHELGTREGYVALNAALSKFAHPTAFTALTFFEGDTLLGLFLLFFLLGLTLVLTAFGTIEEYAASLGISIP